jgi:hypothetical protein
MILSSGSLVKQSAADGVTGRDGRKDRGACPGTVEAAAAFGLLGNRAG